jgi:sugar-specific transcriptional regulator TrmB
LSLERVFKALVSLGLSEIDARVYIYFALKGSENSKTIVKDLKINQQQILQSLKNLQKKDIISQDKKNKTRFIALPFEKTLKLLIRKEKEQTKTFQENLLQKWNTLIKKNSTNSL